MKRINGLLVLLAISFLFKSFGAVHYFSIDSLPGLSVVDLDSNKVVNYFSNAQFIYPYDSNGVDYDSNFRGDFAFSFGNIDPSCGGHLFLSYFPSYHVPDLNKIDTATLTKQPRLDSFSESFGPLYEIDNYYVNSLPIPPTSPINEFYLIKTNENHFALFRIKALLPTHFDPSLLCYIKNAVTIEWWIQDDGNYNKLYQAVAIIYKNDVGITQKVILNNSNEAVFDLMGRKCLNRISSGFTIIQNRNNKASRIASESGMLLSISTRGESTPGICGRRGEQPGARSR